jgi:hypothetical protein
MNARTGRPYVLAALLVVVGAACGDGRPAASDYSGPRYTAATDFFSTRELPNWQVKRDHGSVVFVAPDASGVTISVRAVPLTGDWTTPRTAALVYPATEQVLRGLPHARVSGGDAVQTNAMEGRAYDVSFEPPERAGQRYDRKHVVLLGTKHLFHVLLTGKAGTLGDAMKIFDEVVATLREEV